MIRLGYNETMDRIELLIRAGCPVLYLVSLEETRVFENIIRVIRVIRARGTGVTKNLVTWYDAAGLRLYTGFSAAAPLPERPDKGIDWLRVKFREECLTDDGIDDTGDSVEALNCIRDVSPTLQPTLFDSVAVFFDLYPCLDVRGAKGGVAVRPLRKAADILRKLYAEKPNSSAPFPTIVIVAPTAQDLPAELTQDIVKIEFPLPELAELQCELDDLHTRLPFQMPELMEEPRDSSQLNPAPRQLSDEALDSNDDAQTRSQQTDRKLSKGELFELVANAGRGLPLEKFRSAINIFRVRDNELRRRHVANLLELKAEAVSAEIALHFTPNVQTRLRGLATIVEWVNLRAKPGGSEEARREYRLPPPRGLLLCGASGGGKSEMAKFIAKTFGQALLRLDVGLLFGSYVGESEENTRRTLQLAEALAPVVLWLDEIDKAFSGLDGAGDSGVARRVFGQFLTWMSERRAPVFVVATANDIEPLYERFTEFFRTGRWDQIIFVTLPTEEARREIFRVYLEPYAAIPQAASPGQEQDRRQQPLLKMDTPMLLALARKIGRLGLPQDETSAAAALAGVAEKEAKIIGGLDADPLAVLCWILSDQHFSNNMTGAEIEQVVDEARWEAYRLERAAVNRSGKQFTAALLAERLTRPGGARERALYFANGAAFKRLTAMIAIAQKRHWLVV